MCKELHPTAPFNLATSQAGQAAPCAEPSAFKGPQCCCNRGLLLGTSAAILRYANHPHLEQRERGNGCPVGDDIEFKRKNQGYFQG